MAERKIQSRISSAEIKAGVFLTFCIGPASWRCCLCSGNSARSSERGRQEITVAFAQVNSIVAEGPVFYDGMEIGHVKALTIVRVDQDLLSRMPPLTRRDHPQSRR